MIFDLNQNEIPNGTLSLDWPLMKPQILSQPSSLSLPKDHPLQKKGITSQMSGAQMLGTYYRMPCRLHSKSRERCTLMGPQFQPAIVCHILHWGSSILMAVFIAKGGRSNFRMRRNRSTNCQKITQSLKDNSRKKQKKSTSVISRLLSWLWWLLPGAKAKISNYHGCPIHFQTWPHS